MPLANISTGSTGVIPVQAPTITPMDILSVNRQMNQALMDNINLHQALADELQVSNKRNAAAASGYDLQKQQNQAESGLLPQQVQAKQAALQHDIQVTPAQTQVDVGNLQNQKALQPGQLTIGLQQQNTALPQNQFAENEAVQDPSGGLSKTRQMYESIFGAPLKDEQGSVDYDNMQKANNVIAGYKLRALMMNATSPLTKDLFDVLKSKNRVDLAFNPDGSLRNPAEIAKDASSITTPLNPEDANKAASDYGILNAGFQKLTELKSLINDPAHDVVGPKIGQGDVVGQNYARMKAWLGGDPTKLADQQRVKQAIAQQLGDMMKTFSGIRNQKEFNTLGSRIPDLTNTKENWNQYLDEASNLTKQTMDTIKSSLPNGINLPAAPAAPAAGQSPAPAAPAGAPTDPSKLPVVNSQADYNAIKSGYYRNAAGDVGYKAP